jgi:hypothetical protein
MLVSLSSHVSGQEKLSEIHKKSPLREVREVSCPAGPTVPVLVAPVGSAGPQTLTVGWALQSKFRAVFAGPTVRVLVAPVGAAGPQTLTVGWALQSKGLAVFDGPTVPVLVAPVGSAGPQTLTVGWALQSNVLAVFAGPLFLIPAETGITIRLAPSLRTSRLSLVSYSPQVLTVTNPIYMSARVHELNT